MLNDFDMKKLVLFSGIVLVSIQLIAQNIGIGTTTPAAKLDIRHTSSISDPTLLLYDNSPSNFARLQFQNASGSKYWHIAGYIDDATNANSRLNFFLSNYGDVIGLTGEGKVGIGTQNPVEKLSVVTGSGYGISHTVGLQKISTYIDNNGVWLGSVSNDPLHFYTNNGTAQFSLVQNGNVGIGNTIPSEKLEVAGNIKANSYLYTSPVNKYYTISGVDFRTINKNDNFDVPFNQGAIYLSACTNPVLAPVHLPDGATILSFKVFYQDTHASENLEIYLFSSAGTGTGSSIGQAISSGTPGATFMNSGSINVTVNNTTGFYYFKAGSTTGTWTDSRLVIHRIQINYTMAGTN
jgi:hypothetical protein